MSECISDSCWARNSNFDPNVACPSSGNRGDAEQNENALTALLGHWKKATAGLGISSNDIMDEWFHRLWVMHTEETSHYHTPVHLLEMLSYLYIFLDNNPGFLSEEETNDEQAVLLSIFFHDAVYDPRSATNEEDSVALFQSFAEDSQVMALSLQEKVSKLILATKAHKISQDNSSSLALFLDLDMAVLGKEEQAYMAYAALIRKEFNFVPHETYCEKRAEVLETFLAHDAIYGTSLMHKALEERARSNVRKEIALLRQSTVP